MTDQPADATQTERQILLLHGETVAAAVRVREKRLREAQAAREKRDAQQAQAIEDFKRASGGRPPTNGGAAIVRHGISGSTRQARVERGKALGEELAKARWLAQQQGGRL